MNTPFVMRRVSVPSSPSLLASLLVAMSLALGGCATVKDARGGPGQRLDPWENWNRKVFAFNENLDQYLLKPVATGYAKVVLNSLLYQRNQPLVMHLL